MLIVEIGLQLIQTTATVPNDYLYIRMQTIVYIKKVVWIWFSTSLYYV